MVNDLSVRMRNSGCFKHVNLIFVNALFDATSGYNSLKNREEKIGKFNTVLTAIYKNYHPDAILIACNTLSVLYKDTKWPGKTTVPVIGIVEPGVMMIKEKLETSARSSVILFGTETTIEENSHKNALVASGIAPDRIITKACPQLQSYIEQNPKGEETAMLIAVYLSEALENLGTKPDKLYISLNCSHFGYSIELWENALKESNLSFQILDPNYRMGDSLMPVKYRNRFPETSLSLHVISKVEFVNVRALIDLYKTKNPGLASAIENYSIVPGLF